MFRAIWPNFAPTPHLDIISFRIFAPVRLQCEWPGLFQTRGVGSGDLDITVTALNYRPYMGVITVKPESAVMNILYPSDGPVNR
jgi:hypothetical protein